jgi:hypothetical protein
MKGKLSLLSAAVLLALAGTTTDAAQKPTKASGHTVAPAHFKRPAGTTVLYDQTFSSGIGILSQHFTDSGFSVYDSFGADDFVVTDASGWAVSEVDVNAVYFNGGGPADSFNVIFYNNSGTLPGSVACSATGLSYTNAGSGFQVPLGGSGCNLAAGTYWVSVVANMSFSAGGEFGWIAGTNAAGNSAVWENPGGGIAPTCTTWTSLSSGCFSVPIGNALSFAIVGHVGTGGGGGIALTVGLAEDNGNPTQCGTSTTLSATVGDSINFCYTVTNNSSTTLNFQTLSDDVSGPIFTNMPQTIAPGASFQYNRIVTATASESPTATWVAADVLPGYSNSAGAFNFIDITGSGTALSTGDDTSVDITSPFSFNFYGVTSNEFCVNNNGHAVFATSSFCSGNFLNQSFPATVFASPVFLPFWDDFYTAGNVYFNTVGSSPNRQFVVEWVDKDTFDTQGLTPGYTFELVLNEADGSIDFNYLNVVSGAGNNHDNGGSATIGLQLDTSVFNSFSFDSASLSNSQNIHWTATSPTAFSATAQVTLDVGAPILSLSPTSLSASAAAGTSTSTTLNIGNTGNRDLDWNLTEAPSSAIRTSQARSVYVPNYKSGGVAPNPHAVPQQLRAKEKQSNRHAPLGGVPAFGETFGGSGFNYVSFDASAPGTLNTITAMSSYFFAGTFASNDFTVEYAVDYPAGDLYGIDTATGATQLIGSTGVSGGTISGIRWDPTSGLTYLMSPSGSCGSSTLYTLDLSTGATQSVGTASGVCIIDIAIDPSGAMYGVDIVGDALYNISKTDGSVQCVGGCSLGGFNFNYAEGSDFDPSTGILYFAGFDLNAGIGQMFTIDTGTGVATLLSPIGSGVELDALAIAVASGPCATPSDVPWLSENPISGTTPAGGNDPVAVTFDATSLTVGSYTANVCVNTNDANARHEAVPVTFTVTGIDDTIFQDGFDGP